MQNSGKVVCHNCGGRGFYLEADRECPHEIKSYCGTCRELQNWLVSETKAEATPGPAPETWAFVEVDQSKSKYSGILFNGHEIRFEPKENGKAVHAVSATLKFTPNGDASLYVLYNTNEVNVL